jgi:hypothetical protein
MQKIPKKIELTAADGKMVEQVLAIAELLGQ